MIQKFNVYYDEKSGWGGTCSVTEVYIYIYIYRNNFWYPEFFQQTVNSRPTISVILWVKARKSNYKPTDSSTEVQNLNAGLRYIIVQGQSLIIVYNKLKTVTKSSLKDVQRHEANLLYGYKQSVIKSTVFVEGLLNNKLNRRWDSERELSVRRH